MISFITSISILTTFAIILATALNISNKADNPFFNVCNALSIWVFPVTQFLFVNARFTLTPLFIVTFPLPLSKIGIRWGGKRKKGDEDPVVITQTGSVYTKAKFGAL